jgi:hypothetical protein
MCWFVELARHSEVHGGTTPDSTAGHVYIDWVVVYAPQN